MYINEKTIQSWKISISVISEKSDILNIYSSEYYFSAYHKNKSSLKNICKKKSYIKPLLEVITLSFLNSLTFFLVHPVWLPTWSSLFILLLANCYSYFRSYFKWCLFSKKFLDLLDYFRPSVSGLPFSLGFLCVPKIFKIHCSEIDVETSDTILL